MEDLATSTLTTKLVQQVKEFYTQDVLVGFLILRLSSKVAV